MKKSEIKAIALTALGVGLGFIVYELLKQKTPLFEKAGLTKDGFDSANFDSANFDEEYE